MYSDDMKIVVKGGNKLYGEVSVDGSKNSSLVCMVAASLAEDGSVIRLNNVPYLSDVKILSKILRRLGKTVEYKAGSIFISGTLKSSEVPAELAGALRGSVYCLGLLVGAMGSANVGLPGGDKIGTRPIDIHLEGMALMGMNYKLSGGQVEAAVPKELVGANIYLRYPSVGATCNIMIAAAKATGKTVINNAAREPEIVDLANLMMKMGVKVTGAGSDRVIVHGAKNIHGDFVHDVITDRIEAGVLMTSVAMTGGEIIIKNSIPYHSYPLLYVLKSAGIETWVENGNIIVRNLNQVKPINVTTMPFPGVATDLQPQLAVLSLKAKGESMITDTVFPDRFSYVYELVRMGAKMYHSGNLVRIIGGNALSGIPVEGNDIRAVTALMCAGMIAEGETEVSGISHLNRGYNYIVDKWCSLGADIKVNNQSLSRV